VKATKEATIPCYFSASILVRRASHIAGSGRPGYKDDVFPVERTGRKELSPCEECSQDLIGFGANCGGIPE
jgi:hypothetical protein